MSNTPTSGSLAGRLAVTTIGGDWRWSVIRHILGAVLLTAAVLKAHELATLPLLGPGLLNQRWLLATVVEIELVLGGWLVVIASGWWTWAGTGVLWLAFLGVAGYEAITGAGSCGCFGRVRVHPWYTAAFDLAVVFLLPFCRPGRLSSGFGRRLRLRWAAVGLLGLAGAAFGTWDLFRYSAARLSSDGLTFADGTVVLEPDKWVGHPFTLANYIDIGPQLAHGDWIVLLYQYDCEHCQRAVPRYESFADKLLTAGEGNKPLSVALVEMPPYAPANQELAQPGRRTILGKLSADHDWFATTPVAILVHDDVIRAEREGDAAEDPSTILRTNGQTQ